MKREPKEWEKIFANQIPAKDLTFRIYKEFLQLNKRMLTTEKQESEMQYMGKISKMTE